MQSDSKFIIPDTSCLILLNKIDELKLLKKLNSSIYITPIIAKEFGHTLPDWISVLEPQTETYYQIMQKDIDPGEASAIALCKELKNSIVIIDDLKGRKLAEKLKINFSGTFGLILKAKQIGVIQSVKPILEKISKTNFRFNRELFHFILQQAGE